MDGPGRVTPDIGNAKDPVLKPWAAKQMQELNDEVLTGKRGLPFVGPVDLPSGRRAWTIADAGRAVLFHPDPERGVDDLADATTWCAAST